jgi:predicted transcriptional regulator
MGKLTKEEKIEDITRILNHQTDDYLLDKLHTILKASEGKTERELLLESIRRGEEDIKHGRVYTPEQALERINKYFTK